MSSLSLTEAAKKQLALLFSQARAQYVRLRLRTRGCSGLSYVMEYVDNAGEGDECITLENDTFLCIQKQALLFLTGTEMDYDTQPTKSGFIFRNPHEKGRCGCGTSFHV